MKYFIAGDIHGSEYYCRKMLEAFEMEKADRMILLGDILYHGPRNDLPRDYNTKAVSSMLNEYKDIISCVAGNCDAPVDQWVLEFPIMSEPIILEEGNTLIHISHGHIFNKNNIPALKKDDILLHGHTHVPACENIGDYRYFNPGSVSIPKENSWHGYMTIENRCFLWKDLLKFREENFSSSIWAVNLDDK